jgi:hypothetical protein
VKKQKTDRGDAQLLLRLMREDNFPRIWVPSPENRDVRQLLWHRHRHRLVQMRTRIMNQLQALAMNEGRRWKAKLWSEQGRAELEKLALAHWASQRRKELLELLDRINPTIEELTTAVEQEASMLARFLDAHLHLNQPAENWCSFRGSDQHGLVLSRVRIFSLFFYREGRHSIRLQTESALAHDIQKTLVPLIEAAHQDSRGKAVSRNVGYVSQGGYITSGC